MPTLKSILLHAAVLACFSSVHVANAASVSGTFAGLATDIQFGPGAPPPAMFEGTFVTGTFHVDTDLMGSPESLDSNFASYRLPQGALLLTFSALGNTYVFGNNGLDSAATVFTDAAGQSVLLGANFYESNAYEAMLTMGGNLANGASGLYVDGLDMSTFHAAPVQLGFTDAYFRLSSTVGARVTLSELQFDAVAAVPEPQSVALLLAGLALLGVGVVRERPSPAVSRAGAKARVGG